MRNNEPLKTDNEVLIENKRTLKKKNSVVKIIEKISKISLISVLGFALLREGYRGYSIYTGEYNNQQTIVNNSKELDANLRIAQFYMQNGSVSRLKYNIDKPIYVYVKDGYTPEQKQVIKDVISEFNNIFKDINNNYKFEIVGSSEYVMARIIGHTAIVFDNEQNSSSELILGENRSLSARPFPNMTLFSKISIKGKKMEEDLSTFKYVVMHELLHSFGLGDLYSEFDAPERFSTLMYTTEFNAKLNKIYPNDYAVLLSIYHNILDDNNKVDANKLGKARRLYENYEKEFYKNFIKLYEEEQTISSLSKISDEELGVFSYFLPSTYVNGKDIVNETITFLNNDKFRLNVFKNGENIHSQTGAFKRIENMIILNKDVTEKDRQAMPLDFSKYAVTFEDLVLVRDNGRIKLLAPNYTNPVNLTSMNIYKSPTYGDPSSKIINNILKYLREDKNTIYANGNVKIIASPNDIHLSNQDFLINTK